MAAALPLIVLALQAAMLGRIGSAHGISVRNSPDNEENCVLSFVVPRDKMKSSCDVEAKVQRRISAVETRADVYRQQVTKLSSQLQQQLLDNAARLARVEAALGSRPKSDTGPTLGELSERLAVLERNMNRMYANMIVTSASSDSQEAKGPRVESASSGRLFTDSPWDGKTVDGHERLALLKGGDIESLVKSIVQAEVKKLTADFRDKVQEYDKVFSLFLPADSGVFRAGDDSFASSGRMEKLIKEVLKETTGVHDGTDSKMQELKSDVDSAWENVSEEIAEFIENMTREEGADPGDQGELYLLDDVLSETNDSFSGDGPDFNVTESPEDGAQDFNIGTTRIGHQGGQAVTSGAASGNSVGSAAAQEKLRAGGASLPGWMGDQTVGGQPRAEEERFKSEIRALMVQPLARVVHLVEQQAASLRDEIKLQDVRARDSLGEVTTRLDSLAGRAEAVELSVGSLAVRVQDSQAALGRVSELQVEVHELKKNLSRSVSFLNGAATAGLSREDASILEKHGKHLHKLDRLVNLFNNTLQHYSNEMVHRFKSLQPYLAQKMAQTHEKIETNTDEMHASLVQAMTRVNETLQRNTLRIQMVEDSIANAQIDTTLARNQFERQLQQATGGLGDLRSEFDRLASSHRDNRRKISRLEGHQREMAASVADTSNKLTDLQRDLRLRLSQDWVPLSFQYDASRSGCFGDQYVRRLEGQAEAGYVGVMLCSATRYKIFLSKALDGTFYNVGDTRGMGEDHCEFVGAGPDSEVKVSDPETRFDIVTGYSRKNYGDPLVLSKINLLKPSPTWYECGVSIP
ncbi:hypothetical protein EGW08_005113 [Elysia chlorotica]|uniref:Target of Nesh-SH3/FNDC1 C-terminal domain-containing protein n=1 Tax=Elysia chlorotica TaxID=188477 RepID=A0A3S1CA42_ELYCH|nr:hypothetical protein EGW08_005113 [Elysia chlorotica]